MTLTAGRIADVLGTRSDVAASLADCDSLARRVVDPPLLELCERRVAQLLGDSSAPIDPANVSSGEAACLAFTEHWVIDVASMPGATVAAVAGHLGDEGLMDFVHALLVVEQRIRLDISWRQLGLRP